MFVRGVEFLIVGMSAVFLFLILLVFVLILVTSLLRKLNLYSPEDADVQGGGMEKTGIEQEIAAAIAAIHSLRRKY